MSDSWKIGSAEYQAALNKEAEYWGSEIKHALQQGIPFSVDMRRAQKIFVHRGNGLPQQQSFDPKAEWMMNGELYERVFQWIRSVSPQAKILFLTCGGGGFCLELARQGHHVLGMDISQEALNIATQFADENPYTKGFGSVEYKVTDLNRVELPKDAFDIVMAWDGLHHIVALDRLLQQIVYSLKPGGRFIFSDNIGMQWASRLLGGGMYFLLPTHVSYAQKWSIAVRGANAVKKEMQERSPFEESHTHEIMPLVTRVFNIERSFYHTSIGYRAAIAGDNRLPERLRYPFLRFVKKLDDFLLKTGLFSPDHVLAMACPAAKN